MSGKTNPDRDVKVKIPLDPEEALRALLAVDPEDGASGPGPRRGRQPTRPQAG
jgi:hypothetical protein